MQLPRARVLISLAANYSLYILEDFFLIFKSPISLKLCMWAPSGEATFTWAVPPVFLVSLPCSDGLKVPFSPILHQTPFRKTAGPFFVHGQNVRKLCVCVPCEKGQLFGRGSSFQLFLFLCRGKSGLLSLETNDGRGLS